MDPDNYKRLVEAGRKSSLTADEVPIRLSIPFEDASGGEQEYILYQKGTIEELAKEAGLTSQEVAKNIRKAFLS